jgi:hypothetical protein
MNLTRTVIMARGRELDGQQVIFRLTSMVISTPAPVFREAVKMPAFRTISME